MVGVGHITLFNLRQEFFCYVLIVSSFPPPPNNVFSRFKSPHLCVQLFVPFQNCVSTSRFNVAQTTVHYSSPFFFALGILICCLQRYSLKIFTNYSCNIVKKKKKIKTLKIYCKTAQHCAYWFSRFYQNGYNFAISEHSMKSTGQQTCFQ